MIKVQLVQISDECQKVLEEVTFEAANKFNSKEVKAWVKTTASNYKGTTEYLEFNYFKYCHIPYHKPYWANVNNEPISNFL